MVKLTDVLSNLSVEPIVVPKYLDEPTSLSLTPCICSSSLSYSFFLCVPYSVFKCCVIDHILCFRCDVRQMDYSKETRQ